MSQTNDADTLPGNTVLIPLKQGYVSDGTGQAIRIAKYVLIPLKQGYVSDKKAAKTKDPVEVLIPLKQGYVSDLWPMKRMFRHSS